MAGARGRQTAGCRRLHPLDRADGSAAILLDDQHGAEPYTLVGTWYRAGVSDLVDPALRIVLSTFPNPEKAAEIGRVLVDEQLAACVNIIPQVRSIYRWEGAVQDDSETLAIIKTTAERFDDLAARVTALHPYQVPELIALPITEGLPAYLAWLSGAVPG
jgi:periplasmic divalent cation tolerance protein